MQAGSGVVPAAAVGDVQVGVGVGQVSVGVGVVDPLDSVAVGLVGSPDSDSVGTGPVDSPDPVDAGLVGPLVAVT
jgi:hypothetical protein